jgi:predicted secreted protein
MRRFAFALLCCAIVAPAYAADGSQLRAIGFSPDGRYFAFEQYGIQDGSGSAYADIFVLDTEKDAWVKGTPVKVQGEEGEADIAAVSAKAHAQAKPIIDSLQATAPFDTLVHMPFTEIVAERKKVRFGRYYASSGRVEDYDALGSHELSVKEVPVPQRADCPDADFITMMGMELTLKNLQTGAVKTLAKDNAVPTSRGCAHGYDLEAIFSPTAQGLKRDPHVALIGVYTRGFEGSDRNFIAVPFELLE